MVKLDISFIVFLILVDAVYTDVENEDDVVQKTVKKGKDSRSTSSSSGARSRDGSSAENSISMSFSSASSESKEKANVPKSSADRTGWRKWHRKCPRCLEDERKKWKDPTIKWICGAYQRARRSFKSLCSMHYRNCQDGTMFIKISDHRCPDDAPKEEFPHGDHFFYEYQVRLSDETSNSDKSDSSKEDSEKSVSY